MTENPPRLAGLARALAVKRQRAFLDAIGRGIGARIVYLKASWAEPVLYDGRGDRVGTDIDILVDEQRYDDVATLLENEGFRRERVLLHQAVRGHTFRAPSGMIDVDLHRSLGWAPWFLVDAGAMLERARLYTSVDGDIWGLSPDDQVLHAITHYAHSRYTLDNRHANDVVRLLQRFEVDWSVIEQRCHDGYLEVAFHIFAAKLTQLGASVPRSRASAIVAARMRALESLFGVSSHRRFFTADATTNIRIDILTLFPLLSTRVTALPRFVGRAIGARLP